MRKQPVKLAVRDIEVLIALIDPQNPKFRRTQSETATHLGYPLYAVSRSTKHLIIGKYIRKLEHHAKGALYVPHTNYNIAISQVTDEFREAYDRKVQLVADRVAITRPLSAEMLREPFTLQPHISGAMPYFKVIVEGELQFTQELPRAPKVIPRGPISSLDMRKRDKELNGSKDWDGLFVLDYGRSFKLRYQRTKNCRHFYIGPQYDIESSPNELLADINAPYGRVVLECYPMLNWLSKYAGWQFLKDADGNYIPQNKTPPGSVHIQVNHQPTTDFLTEHVGRFTADDLRADASGSILRYEVNASRPDYVTALVDGPITRLLTFKHERDISEIVRALDAIVHSMEGTIDLSDREIFLTPSNIKEDVMFR